MVDYTSEHVDDMLDHDSDDSDNSDDSEEQQYDIVKMVMYNGVGDYKSDHLYTKKEFILLCNQDTAASTINVAPFTVSAYAYLSRHSDPIDSMQFFMGEAFPQPVLDPTDEDHIGQFSDAAFDDLLAYKGANLSNEYFIVGGTLRVRRVTNNRPPEFFRDANGNLLLYEDNIYIGHV